MPTGRSLLTQEMKYAYTLDKTMKDSDRDRVRRDIYMMKVQDIFITNPCRMRGMWSSARQQSTKIILLMRDEENWRPTWQSRGMLMSPSRPAHIPATMPRKNLSPPVASDILNKLPAAPPLEVILD